MAATTEQIQHRTLWIKCLKIFLSEPTDQFDSKFSWNVPWMVLYNFFLVVFVLIVNLKTSLDIVKLWEYQ